MYLFLLNILCYDLWFYCFHRLLHTKQLFKYHKKHHENREPEWYDTYYSSFLENIISPLGIYIPMIYYNVFDLECILSMAFANTRGLIRHETRLTHIFGDHHIIHHKYYNCNYGEAWIDYFMGTLYKEKKEL